MVSILHLFNFLFPFPLSSFCSTKLLLLLLLLIWMMDKCAWCRWWNDKRIQIYVNFERTTNASLSDIDSDIDGWKYIRILQRNSSCGVKNGGIISPKLSSGWCPAAGTTHLFFFNNFWLALKPAYYTGLIRAKYW